MPESSFVVVGATLVVVIVVREVVVVTGGTVGFSVGDPPHTQCVDGQYPRAQLVIHHSFIPGCDA